MAEPHRERASWRVALAAIAGFLISWQTVYILRPGVLAGVPWPLATIGIQWVDVVLFGFAVVGLVRSWSPVATSPTSPRWESGLPTPSSFADPTEDKQGLPTPPGLRGTSRGTGRGTSSCPSRGEEEHLSVSPPPSWRGSTPSREGSAKWERGWVFGLLAMLAVANAIVSGDPGLTVVGWLRIAVFLLALRGIPRSRVVVQAFLGGFLVAIAGHLLLGFLQVLALESASSTLLGIAHHAAWIRGDAVLETATSRWLRAYGGFPHPNIFGTAILVGLLALRDWMVRCPRPVVIGGRTSPLLPQAHQSEQMRVAMGVWGAFAIVVLILTFSRAAWIGLVILLACMLRHRETRRFAIGGAAIAAVTFLAIAPLIAPRFSQTSPNERRSVEERASGVRTAITLIAAHPILGVGLHAMPAAEMRLGSSSRVSLEPAHDVPLLAVTEIGILGIAGLLIVAWLIVPNVLSNPRLECLVLLPSLLFDHHLWSLPVGLMLLFVCIVASGEDHPSESPRH